MFKTHRTFDLSTGVKNNSIAVINSEKSLAVIYHKTVVVEKQGRKIILRNGGWNTISTAIVINRALEELDYPARVSKKDGGIVELENGVVLPFVNGMVLQ